MLRYLLKILGTLINTPFVETVIYVTGIPFYSFSIKDSMSIAHFYCAHRRFALQAARLRTAFKNGRAPAAIPYVGSVLADRPDGAVWKNGRRVPAKNLEVVSAAS